jgi:hypothetical protein
MKSETIVNFQKYLIFFLVMMTGSCGQAFAQPLNAALHGQWASDDGETTLLISNKLFKFILPPDNNELSFSWINSPPKDGSSPEAMVSKDGEYNVCFYLNSTISRGDLLTELTTEMLKLFKLKNFWGLSQKRLDDEIDSMSKSLKIINNLSDERLSAIACKQLVYSIDFKRYQEIGSGDVVSYTFFYDQDRVYEWIKNFTMGGVSIDTYSRK